MRIVLTIFLSVLSASCLANIVTDVSLGAAVSDTKRDSIVTVKSGLVYYSDWNIALGSSLSYFDDQDKAENERFGIDISVIPYINTSHNNKVYTEFGMRNNLDSLFIGLGSHITTGTPFSFTLASRYYSRIFEGLDEGYYTFSIGLSYDWNSRTVIYKPVDSQTKTLNVIESHILLPKEDSKNVETMSVQPPPPVTNTYIKEDFVTYIVKQGDHLYKIARNHGMSFEELLDVNTKLLEVDNLNLIHPGLVLYVK
ncbi:LysM peptidoglycan-binding domain-containing protein [Vibrio brasiliensis]|uniref:LysM peptidoglycan-binding domain-containing protein n=1 Tax=Vibrio brasiliensis TaxID=170652 RepID=UPI001EFD84AD|nr:LysM peptidoglycan-binding domain-containing protein [Vibrio brasiliensis]MCG9781539.1 LysM peptidoglycan-binding domain-containing protein [Vibrio brasiliensis]